MKNYKTFLGTLLLFVLSLVMTGCDEQLDNPTTDTPTESPTDSPTDSPTETPETETPPSTSFYCNTEMPAVWVFSKDASYMSFYFETNITDFTISSSETWCTVQMENAERENLKRLIINVTEFATNDFLTPRKATVLIKGDIYNFSITIAQNANVSISTLGLPYKDTGYTLELAPGASKEVTIKANCYSWSASTDADWLTLTQKDYTTLIVTSTLNTSDSPRSANVTIVNDADTYNDQSIFTVIDGESELTGKDYNYGTSIGWD